MIPFRIAGRKSPAGAYLAGLIFPNQLGDIHFRIQRISHEIIPAQIKSSQSTYQIGGFILSQQANYGDWSFEHPSDKDLVIVVIASVYHCQSYR